MEEEKTLADGRCEKIEKFVKGEDKGIWFRQCDLTARGVGLIRVECEKLEGDKVLWEYVYNDGSKLELDTEGGCEVQNPAPIDEDETVEL